jgi:DNA helicase-2/ATP-dependent DNA helicase PcrA
MSHVVDSGYRVHKALSSYGGAAAASEWLPSLAGLMKELGELGNDKPATQVELVTRFYTPLLQKNYENPGVRLKDVQNLENIASGYRSRRQFLTDLQLDPPVSTSDLAGTPEKDEDWLVLSTIHSAKGCEWDVVYLMHAADGCLPSDMSTDKDEEIEEEMRLTYVAMTRPRDFLYVTWPFRYYHKWHRYTDRHSYAQLCRFFTGDVLATMEQRNLKQNETEDEAFDAPPQDLTGVMREMWE